MNQEQNPYEAPTSPGDFPEEAPLDYPEATRDECMWGMFAHLSTLAGLFIPFGNIVAPLVIWLSKRDSSEFISDHAREALNFQISMTIYTFVLGFIGAITLFFLVGFVFLAIIPVLLIVDIIVTVLACLRANEGEMYEYPMTLRFVN